MIVAKQLDLQNDICGCVLRMSRVFLVNSEFIGIQQMPSVLLIYLFLVILKPFYLVRFLRWVEFGFTYRP